MGTPLYNAGDEVAYQGRLYTADHDVYTVNEACPPADAETWCKDSQAYTLVGPCD
jgi:hypothetical protein